MPLIPFRALVALVLFAPALAAADVFINEIHYDDSTAAGDLNESVEVVATGGEDLTQYRIVLYNGSGGASYDDDTLLAGTLVSCGATVRIGSLTYATNGLQNGAPDGLALVGPGDAVLQFLSYEGSFAATNGPASGLTSTDIGVSETNSTAPGTSLQLGGNATTYVGFTWNGSATATMGTCNNGQTFGAAVDNPPTVQSSVPANGELDVPFDTSISITFSEPVDVTGTWFNFSCTGGAPTLTASASPATTFTLTPSEPVGYSKGCNLTVLKDQVHDLDGNADAMDADAFIGFDTEADNPPEVVATTPIDKAIDVVRSANLSVTFSEPVNATAAAFAVRCPAVPATPLPFVLTSADDTTFTLNPDADLPDSTACHLFVDRLQVTDRDGTAHNPDIDTVAEFTTAALAPPSVVSTVPAKNATNFPSAGDLQVVFDTSVTLAANAFTLVCTNSTGISLSYPTSGSTFVIGTGTALVAGDTCTLTVEADAVTSGDGLHPASDEVVNFSVASSGAGTYYAQVNDSSAEQLRCSLHEIIDGHTAYPYSVTGVPPGAATDTWDILNLADEDPVDTGMILDVYKNARYTKITGGTGIYNREHTWPNTYGFSGGDPGAYTDIHMLHLTNTQYNSDRGSKPFADCNAGCTELATDTNYGIGGTGGGDSNYVLVNGGENQGSFEVWDHYKGNMARAMMYMVIRYEGDSGEPDLELTDNRSLITSAGSGGKHYMGLLTTLIAWHAADPVDAKELERNELVYGFQNNRNPFVDHPEWGTLALMTSAQPATCTLGGGGNTAPVAVDDLYQATEDALLTVTALDGVLDNDTDAENDALTAMLIAQAINGTVALNSDGSFTYTPTANTCGTDQFTYRASDGQAQSAVAIATIDVACLDDAPVADDAIFALPENSAAATVVGTVVANDPDAGTTLGYAITAGNGSGAFGMSGNQVVVANAAPLNFETAPQFVLTVTVSDGSLTDTAQITINLSNVNEAPAANDATFGLGENSVATTVVGQVVASDVDAGAMLAYSITAGNGSGAFAISPSGQITVANAAPLNFEATPQFVLTVTVSDGSLSDTAQVTVNLSNVNEAPTASDATFGLGENSVATTVVGQVVASDVDAGATLAYSITAGNGSGAFAISTSGQITVANASPLDFESTPQFVLTVTVSDGSLSDTAQITVNLSNVNEAPVAQNVLADRSGSEGVPIDAFSIASGFTDVDAGDDLDYSQTGLPSGLVLDAETGAISGTPAVGSAAGSPYTVTITASDGESQVQQDFEFSIGVLPIRIFASGFEN